MARRKSSLKPRRTNADVKRARNVWVALVGGMTCVGGLLLIASGSTAARGGGASVPALTATETSRSLESIFRTNAAVNPGRWLSIVIHHSAQPSGNHASIDAQHKAAGLAGLGHHFVIGNGQGNMESGELHVGYRWMEQQSGVHAAGKNGDWYNKNAISICLVGDGNRGQFTEPQLQRLQQLVSVLATQLKIPADKIVLHREIATTNDPGKLFPEAWFRQQTGR